MHHSEVIKLVEKFLADPDSVTKGELLFALGAAYDAPNAAYDAADAAYWAAYWADYWTDKARKHVAKYHELTKDKN